MLPCSARTRFVGLRHQYRYEDETGGTSFFVLETPRALLESGADLSNRQI
jgi:hypothetical protein